MIMPWNKLITVIIWVSMAWIAFHFHGKYVNEHIRATEAATQVSIGLATIRELEKRQQDIASLDAKYSKELTDAKAVIDKLQSDISRGARRLQLSATCTPMREPTTTASMDNAARPRLTDSAQRDYFNLRRLIETSNKQIAALQSYINQQCLKFY
ncbi:lysis protein [Salmonella enterica]|nr:lysis protein [Salmonella enterica]EGA0603429.1 lysis protein [Salmonella enterica]EHD2148899.1 lysis protein [Salmonella enterica]EHK2353388.1 lysis protein [Salmonella enterica]